MCGEKGESDTMPASQVRFNNTSNATTR
jgi:hypothetical protein